MASVILSTAASSAASQFGPVGSVVGRFIGSSIGSAIDDKIFGPRRLPDVYGPRLQDLSVQSSVYGKPIPIVFGNARLAGNIIWSRPIKETLTTKTHSQGGKGGGGGKVKQKETTYSYSVSLAIAICEGRIDDIVRVWADAKIVDPTQGTYRLYKGTETQNPDPFIQSFEGVGKTPAYRGMAYVVIEDFPLADFGNRIPNFSFEVKRRISAKAEEQALEEKIKEVVMIPGSGEFVYDTTVQTKIQGEETGFGFAQRNVQIPINRNNRENRADAVVSLNQLERELPNVEWVSVVAGWFGNSLDAGDCVLKPGVEFRTGATTTPEIWSVAGFSRSNAHEITHIENSPVYGGTPDDQSLVRYVTALRNRGYKVLFYPFIFMDMDGKPWRGRITGSTSEVSNFFTKTNGYNTFILHYANLLDGKIDAFAIGSEMVGLTSVKDGGNNFPGVTGLVSLAASVKSILGGGVKVTYGADWSEYHHTGGGWYNLDPLWASSSIDVIGIDAYFPLTDEPQSGYDKEKIMDGWTSGEGYDWYYSDEGRTSKAALTPQMAWKNIEWWWKNYHVNPNSATTAWVPESKKIWFTEFGFPSVDGATNQPNVFYNPESSESSFPRFSRGRVDFRIQRTAIEATLEKWEGSGMVERKFLWTWDTRPYPFYPDLRHVWSDGNVWMYGHWVTGKLGLSSLAAIIAQICARAGLPAGELNLDDVYELVEGFVINSVSPARAALEQLQKAYFFDVTESDGKLKFITRGKDAELVIDAQELIPPPGAEVKKLVDIKRAHELELPQQVDINYISRILDYQIGNQHAGRNITQSQGREIQNLAIVLNDWQAKRIADISLYNIWLARNSYQFSLPLKYAHVEPADVIEIDENGTVHKVRVTDSLLGANGQVNIRAVAEDASVYDVYVEPDNSGADPGVVEVPSDTAFHLLDIPSFPMDDTVAGYIRIAAAGFGGNWPGAVVYRSDDGGMSYQYFSEVSEPAVMGVVVEPPGDASANVTDTLNEITVSLIHGELESVGDEALLNGANAAVVGDEIIQFREAELLAEGKYKLSGLLRGRLGTERFTASHEEGEKFVLLNSAVIREQMPNLLIGVSRKYKVATVGSTLALVGETDFTWRGEGLKPYSPVHITGSRDGGGNLGISWVRRTRIGGELRDGVDIPLSEESEKYEVEIMDGADVARVITSSTPSVTYSAAQQADDFGSPQSAVSVRVYQLSAIAGRGAAGVAEV